MELYTIEGSNNKLHEIRTNDTSIFISYSSKVAIFTPADNGTLFINRYYKHYSHTTDRHFKLMEDEYFIKNIIYLTVEEFNELLIFVETDPETFNKLTDEIITKYNYEVEHLQRIKTGNLNNIPPIKESTTIKDTSLKTRNKIINKNTTTTGIKFQIVHTETKTGRLINTKMKLDNNYNLLSVY